MRILYCIILYYTVLYTVLAQSCRWKENFRNYFRFSVPCIFCRSQIRASNRCSWVYIFIECVFTLHVSGLLLAHHQGCLGLLVHAAIWFMQCCCISVCLRTVALSYSNVCLFALEAAKAKRQQKLRLSQATRKVTQGCVWSGMLQLAW
jgi:hypothetical protein